MAGDDILALIKEYKLEAYEEFIREQAGSSPTIARYLCEALSSIAKDTVSIDKFAMVKALDHTIEALSRDWGDFVEREGDQCLRKANRIVGRDFLQFLAEKRGRRYNRQTIPRLVDKIVFIGKHAWNLYTLVVTVRRSARSLSIGVLNWDVTLENFRLYKSRSMIVRGDDCQCCPDLGDLLQVATDMRKRAREQETSLGYLIYNRAWEDFWNQLLQQGGSFDEWLKMLVDLRKKQAGEPDARVIFESSAEDAGYTLAIPFELTCLSDEHKQHWPQDDSVRTPLLSLLLFALTSLPVARRFQRDTPVKPLSLSELCLEDKDCLPKVKGHIIYCASSENMKKAAEEIYDIWEMARIPSSPLASLGEARAPRLEKGGWENWEGLEKYLRGIDEDSWHAIHFVGHGKFDENSGASLTVGSDLVSPQQLAEALDGKQIKMIFFSFCESAASTGRKYKGGLGFIEYFVKETTVPTLLGFQWRVDTDAVSKLALAIYENFLHYHLELPIALHKAKAEIWNDHDSDPRVWLSPVLVYQDFSSYP